MKELSFDDKVQFMISALRVAQEEMGFAEEYESAEKHDRFYRMPNYTLIRENLKMVGRMGFLLEKEI